MQFSKLSDYLEQLEQTPSRLEMMYKLSDLYKELSTEEITQASYLMQGSLVPRYLSLEFQLSVKMVVRALTKIYSQNQKLKQRESSLFGEVDPSFTYSLSTDLKTVTKMYKTSGDVGIVAKKILEKLNRNLDKSLSIVEVHEKLKEIAMDSGSGSQDRKVQKLVDLLSELDPVSAKFVGRIVIGKLRLGFSAMTILDALSWAAVGTKEHRKDLEVAYQKRADIGELSKLYLEISQNIKNNSDQLIKELHSKYLVVVGTPLVPALCQRLNTSQEIIDKMDEVIAEPKYDGLRIQIHYSKRGFENDDSGIKIKAFTRNLEDVTHMFPELEIVTNELKCDSCILDAEAIGYNKESGKLLPFQETITRKRKHLVAEQSSKVPIRFYFFDLMFLNSRPLLKEILLKRKELLRGIFIDSDTLMYTPTITTTDPKVLRDFHNEQLGDGLEGAVMKKIDSVYQSGRKGWLWVKIKEEEGARGKLKDTLDLVVMGYYYGRGKRSKFGIGAFLVGALNDNQEVKTMAKVGTGLSDDQFRDLKKRGDALEVNEKPNIYEVAKALIPDIWMSPELVAEIAADEITKSPNHTAGVALRFPRLVKFRDDKSWNDATTINELDKF